MFKALAQKMERQFRWDFIKGLAKDGQKELPSIGMASWRPGQRVVTIALDDATVEELEAEHGAHAHYETVTSGQDSDGGRFKKVKTALEDAGLPAEDRKRGG